MSGESEDMQPTKRKKMPPADFLYSVAWSRSIVPENFLQLDGRSTVHLCISGTIDLYHNDINNMSGELEGMHQIKRIKMLPVDFLYSVACFQSIVTENLPPAGWAWCWQTI
jgi:hypothetical protein